MKKKTEDWSQSRGLEVRYSFSIYESQRRTAKALKNTDKVQAMYVQYHK